jgi:SAM-dependent methyltransferase
MDTMARGGVRRYLDTVRPEEYIPDTGEVDLSQLTLTGLADLYGSDKGSIKHGYTKFYQKIIDDIVALKGNGDRLSSTISIAEVGVACGASLRMWSNYLPKSKVIGFDIRDDCKHLCSDLSNVEIRIQDPANDLPINDRFDIFIDDASHISEHIVNLFINCWKLVKPGGYYVIEDLRCTYNDQYKTDYERTFNCKVNNDRSLFIDLFDKILKQIDCKSDIECVYYYAQLLIVKKTNNA